MPAQSKAQQRAAGAALAAKRGEVDPKTLAEASRDMYDSMTEDELEELASTKLEGLPDHKPH
jgi:aconitase B